MAHPTSTEEDIDLSSMLGGVTSIPLSAAAACNRRLFEEMREYDPVRLATSFCSLLTVPELQSNSIRLEALVHLALALANGTRKPRDQYINEVFSSLDNGPFGLAEDPAEDIFVGSVATPRGNFRVLEGTWESAGFYLQRVLDAVEKMPTGSGYDDIRESIYSLLRMSDEVCERTGLVRYQLGNDVKASVIPTSILRRLSSIRQSVRFSQSELDELGISSDHLSAFGFVPDDRQKLSDEALGHTSLERCPVLYRNGQYYLVLPTAVSVAIRWYVVEKMTNSGMLDAFIAGVGREFASTFGQIPLLGGRSGAPIRFGRTKNGILAGAMTSVEPGRFLSFIFVMDTLEDFDKGGFGGFYRGSPGLESDINAWIDQGYDEVKLTEGFRDGLTLIIGCGLGRGIAFPFHHKERSGWRVEFVSAADLYTLSWTEDFKPLSLWRLLAALDKVEALGVTLENINGLLNMVAWARELNGHLIPHAILPDDFVSERASSFIMIEQNALRTLRHEVATEWDMHSELDVNGDWIRVRRNSQSPLREDLTRPLYAEEEPLEERGVRAVYVTKKRSWWCKSDAKEETPGSYAYQRWRMVTTWLSRAAPVLEDAFPGLPDGPIQWTAHFEGDIGEIDPDTAQAEFASARANIEVRATAHDHSVTTIAGQKFEEAQFSEDNIAERALVDALVQGISALAGQTLDEDKHSRLMRAIVPDTRARLTHLFRTKGFRDFVQRSLPQHPVYIDEMEAATIRLGLGWTVRDRSAGSVVEGKAQCLSYLDTLVQSLETDLCEDLRSFDRKSIIQLLLQNHEAAVVDRERWSRTAAAVLSLHDNKADALEDMALHDFKLNAIFQATRLLCEIAICECQNSSGRTPAESDLSRLMAKMMSVQQLGGWSDSIRWDVMEPYLKIRPYGDVHAKLDFDHDIIGPFARTTADIRVMEAVSSYAQNLIQPEERGPVEDVLESQFLSAWRDQTGASLEDMLLFVDYVEDYGVRAEEAVLTVPRSRLLGFSFDGKTIDRASNEAIVEFLTFRTRPKWREVPAGYRDSDRHPWRFRRQLSVLRRPLLQIDDGDDPMIIVAPGLLRDAFMYMIGNYHRGDFPARQLRSGMRSWAGTTRDKVGHEFNLTVAARLKELGWQAEPEVKITRLLKQGFDRDYGDVDVIAWNPETGRVLIIECKDVQYRKTYGEIAEQLADFRGGIGPNGKRDNLRKHLDRVELASMHLSAVAQFVAMPSVTNLESHLVFKNPVPMQFALKHMAQQVVVTIFDGLDKL